MFGRKYISMTEGYKLENPAAEYKTATRAGQYKVSEKGIFRADGKYLPFAAVTDVICDKTSVHVSGCCAGGVPVERIVFVTAEGKFPFIFDTKKDQSKVLDRMENKPLN